MTNFKTRAFNPLPSSAQDIEAIIAAPLMAASNANQAMMKAQTEFIMTLCFAKKGNTYEPVMVAMTLTRTVKVPQEKKEDPVQFESVTTSFNIPLLTLIPMNTLGVDNVNVDFEMEITDQINHNQSYSKVNQHHFGPQDEKTQLKGKISYDSKEQRNSTSKSDSKRQNSSKLSVKVHAGTVPIPDGMKTILELYLKTVQPQNLNQTENQ